MFTSFYDICASTPAVTDVLGSPPRIFPFDEAMQNTASPYVVYHEIGGSPENFLAGRPDMDDYRLQIDVYAQDGLTANSVKRILFDAIELECHVVGFNGESRDKDTREYRSSFDVEWYVER